MKNIFLSFFFISSFAFAQNTVTDYDGNSYDFLTYGDQQWTIENAAMETYRDGTPIPQITDTSQWVSMTTGAWCYVNNDSTKDKLYNWYAVAGIHDNDPSTPNKHLAPEGWHVPSNTEWNIFQEHLILNNFNYDGTNLGNKIAKALATTDGWNISTTFGTPGNEPDSNNSSGFNAFPNGDRNLNFYSYGHSPNFWTSSEVNNERAFARQFFSGSVNLYTSPYTKYNGDNVRFVQDSDSCSEASINASSTEVCIGDSIDLSVVSTSSGEPTAGSTACTSSDLPANLQTGLVGYWPFCGNANDVVQDNNGQSVGASLTTDRFENFNSAYIFDQNSHISLSEPFFDGNTAVSSFSYSTWIYVDQYPNSNVSINTKEGYWRTIGMFFSSDGGIRFGGSQPSPQAYHNIVSPSNKIIIQQWNHIVVTFDNSNLKIFINGVLEASTTISISSWNYEWFQAGNSTNTNLIGASNPVAGGVQNYFTGKIDDFSIWNRALSFTEITSVYNSTSTSYLWSTGDTTANISVTPTETTEYWVDVTTNGVTCREYITISVTAPAAPTGDAEQTFCDAATVADLTATGENIQWYDAATYGNLLDATAALTDGQVVYASSTNEININNGIDLSYNNWNIPINGGGGAEPSDSSLGEHHAIINDQFGLWDDYEESTNLKHLMESNNDLGIISGYDYLGVYNSSFYYRSQTLSGWNDAKNTASQAGGWLATFESLEENNFVSELNVVAGFEQVWIGLFQDLNDDNYIEPDGAWKWLNTITCIGSRLMVTVTIQDINITASETEVCAGDSVDLTVSSGLTAGTTACNSADLPANLQTGLVGYWPFCGNAIDESVNGNNGTVNGATLTTDRFGNPDSAYSFDGIDDFINRETNSFISNSFSFSLFVKPNSEENIYNQGFVGNTGNFTPNNCVIHPVHGAVFGDPSQNAGVGFYVGSNGIMIVEHSHNFIKVSLSHEIVINDWVNIFISYENKLPKLYINGEFIKSGVSDIRNVYASIGNDNTSYENYSNNGIGAGFNQSLQFFDGFIDDIIHWNRALTPSEIQELANSSTYLWSTGDTTENISVTPTETTEYWVDVTNNGVTCREYITINVTAPAAPTGNSVQGGCSDFTVGSNNNAFTGENLQWYANPSGGTALPDNHLLVDGTYYYISQTVDGCESIDRFEFQYLAPEPTITIVSPLICEGESATVSVTSSPFAGTATFLWNTGETSETITLSPTESTSYWVDQVYNSGSPENIQTVCRYFFGVAVDQAPDSPISGGDITECETIAAQNLVATVTANTGQTIIWYDALTSGGVVSDPSLNTAGTVTYYAETISDSSGCPSLSRTAVTLTITSIDSPTGDSVQSFCDVSTIADLTVTGDDIQWYDSATGGTLLDDTTVLIDGQLVYASQTLDSCESLDRLGVSVEIDIITDPILITTELNFCLAREATLADLEIDAQGFELEWYDSYTGGTLLGLDTILEDAIPYYATLYDVVSGCESLMRLEVIPAVIPCEVIIYNAISLNDNGLNDYMVIENAEYFPFNTLEIFNRDGYLVYNQRKYGVGDNLFRGMANVGGIYSQGSNLPTGSYLYVFTYYNPYEQQEFVKKGFLTINNN